MERSKIFSLLTGACLVFVVMWSCADHEFGSYMLDLKRAAQ
ncbi:hypothetical protein [Chryseosolibacter histidini]|nr:hypothetical protein [Chryseosolibacter histidini]